jgi:hypothetical protein
MLLCVRGACVVSVDLYKYIFGSYVPCSAGFINPYGRICLDQFFFSVPVGHLQILWNFRAKRLTIDSIL